MVTQTEMNDLLTTVKHNEQQQPSLKRWLKHFFFLPATQRYFNQQDIYAITQAVQEAERGHVGEIQVVIEGNMPINKAYYFTPKLRAQQLFAELGIWDTEYNSGVLIYLNLCERAVEVVTDRGICRKTSQAEWDAVCSEMVLQLKQKNYRQAVLNAVQKVGHLLDQFYDNQVTDISDELNNTPIIL